MSVPLCCYIVASLHCRIVDLQAESQLLQRVICSITARFALIVVGGVGEGFDKEENLHRNPLGLVLGSELVESV